MMRPHVGREISWPRCGRDLRKMFIPNQAQGGRGGGVGAAKVPPRTRLPIPGTGDVGKRRELAKGPSKATQVAFGRRVKAAPKRPRGGKGLILVATAEK